ncbi:MAG TPA: YvcK family protein [Atribacteraceae bacterium]|nr:YvcK family protein [Atribacteraceae bacterium]
MPKETQFRKSMRWLYPGMQVKRWLLLAILGVILISIGVSLILYTPYFRSIYVTWNRFVFHVVKDYWTAVAFGLLWLIGGVSLIVIGLQKMNRSVIDGVVPALESDVASIIFKKRQLEKGPNILAVGGGHGLHTLLHGIKKFTSNTTAVVTVFDDGGSSGRLRKDLGILPPGDIRNCLIALADTEPLMRQLFQHRFDNENELKGHNFGNLFITALTQVTGDFQKAIVESSKVLAVKGRVLPTTLQNVTLQAECEDGTLVSGESNIGHCFKKIKNLFLEPTPVLTTPDVLRAIQEADLIVLGPGSLFTSVLCNLAVQEVRDAIVKSRAPLIYVLNVTTQPGETDHFSPADHLDALFRFIPQERLNHVLINNQEPSPEEVSALRERGVEPICMGNLNVASSTRVITAPLLASEQPTRHDSEKLARAIMHILLEEKPAWGFFFALYTEERFKRISLLDLVSGIKERRKTSRLR